MRLKIKSVKNFNKEEDVLVIPEYVEVPHDIQAIRVPEFTGLAIIKTSGSFGKTASTDFSQWSYDDDAYSFLV